MSLLFHGPMRRWFLAGWMLVAFHLLATTGALSAGEPPYTSVILISVDTLRADRLSCYGYQALQTHHIDAIGKGGTLFAEANSQVPLTLPSHVSLLTSTYPFSNGIEDQAEQLPRNTVTLAAVLKSQGYYTAAFVGGFVLDRRFGLDQGFDAYDSPFDLQGREGIDPSDLKRPGEEVSRAAMQWLDKNSTHPFFVFLHLFDLHTPYKLTPAQRARFGTRGYDSELSYVDTTLGTLWTFLAAKHLLEKTLVVFLADHGESLGEHGENTHGYFIYQSTLRVPLIIHWPTGQAPLPARVAEPVSLLDVAPTILEFLGVPRPRQFQGRSLLELPQQKALNAPREIYSESIYAHNHYGCSPLSSLRVGKYKYIEAPKREFYDLSRDPAETNNLYTRQESFALTYRQRLLALRSHSRPARQAQPQTTNREILERLASLGYVASAGSRTSDSESGADPKDRIADYAKTHRAIALAYSGRLNESAALLDSVVAKNPDLLDSRNVLGLIQQKLGRHEQALSNFQKVLQKDPMNFLAHYNAGVSYFALRRLDESVKELQATVATASPHGEAAEQATVPAEELLGRIWLEKKDYTRAREQFSQVLAIAPGSFWGHYGIGWLAVQDQKWDEAIYQLSIARNVNSGEPGVRSALGTAYFHEGNLNQAHIEFAEAVRLDPKSAWTHYNMGLIWKEEKKFGEAAGEFQKTLAIDPGFQAAREALRGLDPGEKSRHHPSR